VKSSTSGSYGCVEARWRTATASVNSNCVEVAFSEVTVLADGAWENRGRVEVRDSKDPAGPVLVFTPHEWRCFLDGVRRDEFDLPAEDEGVST
jgi:hypothetical protein